MRKQIFIFFSGLLLCGACAVNTTEQTENTSNKQDNPQQVQTIAFGSCNRQDKPQPLWSSIINENPDLWIWLGDNIYGDTQDMTLLKDKYETQKNQPEYRKLTEMAEVIGIWDDHDYGINDGGTHYSKKDSSQSIMLDFLDEPADSPRRKQAGAYGVYEYKMGDNAIKVFLLDARYHRDTLFRENKTYLPNNGGNILGEAQWRWLEEGLKNSLADINLIASGIQFIPEEHPYEKWENFPAERQKLFDLLTSSGVRNPVLLSGDRHIAEVSKIELQGNEVYEITSSGLTHTWNEYKDEPNKFRQGALIVALNYGILNIDWEQEVMHFAIKGEGGNVLLEQKIDIEK